MKPLKTLSDRIWIPAAVAGLILLLGAQPTLSANDDFIILLDQSGSMREKTPGIEGDYFPNPEEAEKSREALEALDQVVQDLVQPGDYIGIIPFGSRTKVIVSQQLLYPHERDIIREIVTDRLRFKDKDTDIVAGVAQAGKLIDNLSDEKRARERRKILVMITDGKNEPPPDSEFYSASDQQRAYRDLRERIAQQNWKVTLVGLGSHADITDIGANLGLDQNDMLTIDPTKDNIRERLYEAIKQKRDATISASKERFEVRLEPRLFGGYDAISTVLELTSSYSGPMGVALESDIELASLPGLAARAEPTSLKLQPGQRLPLRIDWSFSGPRPENGGVLIGRYNFKFLENQPKTTPFYPNGGEVELIVLSWWDIYGLRAVLAVIALAVVLLLALRALHKYQVLEIRVAIVAGNKDLRERQTVRKRQQIDIGTDVAGGGARAEGLSVERAATVTYLGRKRFRVVAQEASLYYDGAEKKSIEIGLDDPFDLRDPNGKMLAGIMISESEAAADFLGGDDDASPF
jgi:hypothetical protein